MKVCNLWYFCEYLLVLLSAGQPVFECPNQVAYGSSANLTCSGLQNSVNVDNGDGEQVATCVGSICAIKEENVTITFIEDNTLLLTVHEIDKEDEGEWTCQSGEAAKCSLNVYKTPSCEISSNSSTNDLSLGQDLTLNINLTDYYCTNSIVWNFQIGGTFQNITELLTPEVTEHITNRVVTYSSKVTSSLHGHVQLTFSCNGVVQSITCIGVKGLQQRGALARSTINLIIGSLVGIVVLAVLLGAMITWNQRNHVSSFHEAPVYDIPLHDTDTEVRYQDLIRDLNIAPAAEYESFEDTEQEEATEKRIPTHEADSGDVDSKSRETESQEYLSAVFER